MPTHDELVSYVDQVENDADLRTSPPIPIVERPEWTWNDVVIDDVDRGLERWAWGIARWGKKAAVAAAIGVLENVMPLWDRASADGSPGTKEIVENAERGFGPSPRALYERLVAWQQAPSADGAKALQTYDLGDHLGLLDVIGNEEFREVWSDAWMFALTAVYAAALLPAEEANGLPRLLGIVAVSGRRALADEPEAASRAFQWMATKIRAST